MGAYLNGIKISGQDGTAATITVGSVTTGAAGTSASVTNVGTESAAKLNFTIPQGAKGDKGDKGDPGSNATVSIVNNLTSTSTTSALSAAQGKALNDNKVATTRTIAGKALSANITSSDLVAAIKTDLVNLLYPVGAIYVSVTNTNPGTFLGGTWSA